MTRFDDFLFSVASTPAMQNATTKIRHSSELGTLYPEKGSAKRYFHVVMDEVASKTSRALRYSCGRIDPAKPDAGTDFDELMQTISSTLETLGRINSDEYVSPVKKSFLKERLQDIRTEYELSRTNALPLRYRSVNSKVL